MLWMRGGFKRLEAVDAMDALDVMEIVAPETLGRVIHDENLPGSAR